MKPRLTLERIKRSHHAKALLLRRQVRIWSNEWRAWWNPKRSGYTIDSQNAGIYSGEDALACSGHAGPEKGIEYELI